MATPRGKSKPQTGPRASGNNTAAKSARDKAMDAALVVDGESYRLGDLELGELGELEEHVGLPMDSISYGSARVVAFVIYLVRRRANPEYSLDDAKRIKISEVQTDGDETDDDGSAIVGAAGRPTTPGD